jgi:hypothetical protein
MMEIPMTQIRCPQCGATVTATSVGFGKTHYRYGDTFFKICHESRAGEAWNDDEARDCTNMIKAIEAQI